jgi:hypothetical protein
MVQTEGKTSATNLSTGRYFGYRSEACMVPGNAIMNPQHYRYNIARNTTIDNTHLDEAHLSLPTTGS